MSLTVAQNSQDKAACFARHGHLQHCGSSPMCSRKLQSVDATVKKHERREEIFALKSGVQARVKDRSLASKQLLMHEAGEERKILSDRLLGGFFGHPLGPARLSFIKHRLGEYTQICDLGNCDGGKPAETGIESVERKRDLAEFGEELT